MAEAGLQPGADAVARSRLAVEARPDDGAAWLAFADALRGSGSTEEALDAYRRSTGLAPDNPDTFFRLGHALMAAGKFDEAIDAYRRVTALQPGRAAAWANIGLALERLDRIDEAIAALKRAVAENPRLVPAHSALGNIWLAGGDAPKAIEAYESAVALKADDIVALCNLSTAYLRQERIEEAEAIARRAVAAAPRELVTHRQLASVLSLQDRPLDTIAALRAVLQLDPNDESIGAELLYQARQVCDWETVADLTPRIVAATARALAEGRRPVATPFTAIAIDPPSEGAVAKAWAAEIERDARRAGSPFVHPAAALREGPLRIGYLSSDFRAHATMHLIGSMLQRHDRARVRCHVYSYGVDDSSQHRKSVMAAADFFVDLRSESDRAAAQKIFDDGVDILVDLKGHTAGARLGIAALRPAPVQVTWLGFPGPVGASFFDYTLVDRTVVPPEHRERYVEGLCYLPHCYQINDDTQTAPAGATDRAAQGLPAQGFVFASFNRVYKLTDELLDLWASILADVPGSLLWLYRSRPEAVGGIGSAMQRRFIDPARLVFAPPQGKARHLQRIPLADLALDTFPINGHTTTSDCLKSGLPVVAMLGEHFASRVSASLLRTIGLDELVAANKSAYREIAVALARDPARLASLRATLRQNCRTSPLFDTPRFVANLETAYETMWQHRCAGALPRVLEIGERDGRN
ncbi:MAG: tetratricopeptide repeat protein [Dongiaceae bacterium]